MMFIKMRYCNHRRDSEESWENIGKLGVDSSEFCERSCSILFFKQKFKLLKIAVEKFTCVYEIINLKTHIR